MVRVCIKPEGAFSVWLRGGVPNGLVSLERTYPVAESEPYGPQFVKVPPGIYRCEKTFFVRGNYDTYEVTGVPGHTRILLHAGNLEAQSEGCPLLGQRFGKLSGQPAVLQSRLAHAEFMADMIGEDEFWLKVRNGVEA